MTHSSGKLLFACRIIPYRARAGFRVLTPRGHRLCAPIGRPRKFLDDSAVSAVDQEAIMSAYYDTLNKASKSNTSGSELVTKFFPDRVRAPSDLYW